MGPKLVISIRWWCFLETDWRFHQYSYLNVWPKGQKGSLIYLYTLIYRLISKNFKIVICNGTSLKYCLTTVMQLTSPYFMVGRVCGSGAVGRGSILGRVTRQTCLVFSIEWKCNDWLFGTSILVWVAHTATVLWVGETAVHRINHRPLTQLNWHNSPTWDFCQIGGIHLVLDEHRVWVHEEHPGLRMATKQWTQGNLEIPWQKIGLNLRLLCPWDWTTSTFTPGPRPNPQRLIEWHGLRHQQYCSRITLRTCLNHKTRNAFSCILILRIGNLKCDIVRLPMT